MTDEFSWSDSSALYQLEHGEAGPRTDSARQYLEGRLAGHIQEGGEASLEGYGEDGPKHDPSECPIPNRCQQYECS